MLILASGSKYRKMLLGRFGIPFACQSPEIDESTKIDESAGDLVSRLAYEKAECVSIENPQAIVIGSDQIAVFEDQIVGKPGTHLAAKEQLLSFSGQSIEFLTGVSVQCGITGFKEQHIDLTRVRFRPLQVASPCASTSNAASRFIRTSGIVPLNILLPSAARFGEIQSGYSRDIASQSLTKPKTHT